MATAERGPAMVLDPVAEAELCAEGWTVIPFLGAAEVERLDRAYASMHPQGGYGFDTDFAYVEPGHREAVDALLRPVVERALATTLAPVRAFNLSFVTKWPDDRSALPLHQDWTYVDERAHRSLSVWIPLCDVAAELDNGPVAVLPRSHLLPHDLRGVNVRPWFAPWASKIADHLVPVAVPAGHALIFDNRLLHASSPNRSEAPRIAVVGMVAPADAALRYVHSEAEEDVIYEVDPRFFVAHSPLDLRSGPKAHARIVHRRQHRDFEPPLEAMRAICGLELAPDDAVPTEDPPRLPGAPLADGGDGRGGIDVYRARGRVSRRAPFGERLAAAFDRGAAVWASKTEREWHDLAERPEPEAWGPWATVSLAAAGRWTASNPEIDRLRRELAADGDLVACDLHLLGPEFTLLPRASGRAGTEVYLLPLECPLPLGSAAVQVGRDIRPLCPGEVVRFDPSLEHRAWSLGTRASVVLAVHLTARVRRGFRRSRTRPSPPRSLVSTTLESSP